MIVYRSSSSIAVSRLVERVRRRRCEVAAVGGETFEVVVREHVGEPRCLLGDRLDLGELGCVLAHHADGLRMGEQVADVALGARGVDRDDDRADLGEREVEQRPVEAVLGEEAHRIALAHAAGEKAVRVVADALVRLRPAHLAPAAFAVLDEVCGRRPPGSDRVPPEAGDRPALAEWTSRLGRGCGFRHVCRAYSGPEGVTGCTTNPPGPPTVRPSTTCGPPGTAHSASASCRSPSGLRPRRSLPRASRMSRSGSSTGSA